jgi:hypothetical protein
VAKPENASDLGLRNHRFQNVASPQSADHFAAGGDTPNSSDGVVPYWSSHLNGAQSELIVPSDHMALRNPEAIKEVERILKTYP